jgi:hypothetical protein
MDPDGLPAVAVLLAGVSFSNTMVLHRLTQHDPAGTRKWRKIAFRSELGLAAALAVVGTYLIVSSAARTHDASLGWDAVVGFALIGGGALPLAALSLIDLAAFKLEDYPAHFSMGLKIPPPGSVFYVPVVLPSPGSAHEPRLAPAGRILVKGCRAMLRSGNV